MATFLFVSPDQINYQEPKKGDPVKLLEEEVIVGMVGDDWVAHRLLSDDFVITHRDWSRRAELEGLYRLNHRNSHASFLLKSHVYGQAIVCSPEEAALLPAHRLPSSRQLSVSREPVRSRSS